jgi:hypothetical protein
MGPSVKRKDPAKLGDREKMISQIPDLAKHQNQRVELRGFDSSPLDANEVARVHTYCGAVARGRL